MKKSTFRAVTVATACVAMTTLAACGGSSGGGGGSHTIPVVALGSQTGLSAGFGAQEVQGEEFAFDQFNASGGYKGYKFNVTVINDNSDASVAATKIRNVLSNTVAIVGPGVSTISTAIQSTVGQAGVPMLALVGSTNLTSPLQHSIFRVFANPTYSANALMRALKAKNVSRIAVIYEDVDFGSSGSKSAVAAAKTAGIDVVSNVSFPPTASDYTSVIVKSKAANPQAYIVWTGEAQKEAQILSTMAAQGITSTTTPIVGPPAIGEAQTIKLAGSATQNVLYADQLATADPRPGSQTTFLEAWKAKFGGMPSSLAMTGYSAGAIVVQGVKLLIDQKKDVTAKNLADVLETLNSFDTPLGPITYTATDHEGLGPNDVQVNVIRDGKSYQVK